ncbi:MAG: hypothetical protein HYU69_09680 [Bacteroidetes bacterium]|nr:hypothetical protein [Bacteroidota bacterium]
MKSLDTHERVYFKKYVINNLGRNSYIQVFDCIDKMKVYDENVLKIKLRDSIKGKGFKWLKKRTYEAIVKSLSDYHSDSSIGRILQNLIHRAELLIRKKLNVAAEKTIKKAEELARKTGENEYLLIILNLKTLYWRRGRFIEDLDNYCTNGGFDNEISYANETIKIIELRRLATELERINLRYSNLRDKGFIKKINSISKSPLLRSVAQYKTGRAIPMFYNVHYSVAGLTNKFDEKSYWRQMELIKYLERDKKLLPYKAYVYISALSNLIILLSVLGNRRNEIRMAFEKARSFYLTLSTKHQPKIVQHLFVDLFANYIGHLYDTGAPEESINVWNKMEKNNVFNITELRSEAEIALYTNLALCYFSLKRYRETLKQLNIIISKSDNNNLRMDVQGMAKILVIIVHYELKNYELLPYLIKQTKNYLKKKHLLFEFEKIMLNFFGKVAPVLSEGNEKSSAFIELKKEALRIFRDPVEAKVLNFFDFVSWIDSKIEKEHFADIIRRKAKLLSR